MTDPKFSVGDEVKMEKTTDKWWYGKVVSVEEVSDGVGYRIEFKRSIHQKVRAFLTFSLRQMTCGGFVVDQAEYSRNRPILWSTLTRQTYWA